MKTREEAEQRALELYPTINYDQSVRRFQREAYLQCFDDMQKAQQKEALIEITDNELTTDEDYRNGVRDVVKYLLNAQPTDDEEVIDNYTGSIVNNDQLREAAERVVAEYYNHSLCGKLIESAILELEKALNQNK